MHFLNFIKNSVFIGILLLSSNMEARNKLLIFVGLYVLLGIKLGRTMSSNFNESFNMMSANSTRKKNILWR